jgi:hypothetical protein
MLSSIAVSGRCSELKPTNTVPWSVTVPESMSGEAPRLTLD